MGSRIPECRYKVVRQLGDGTYGSVWKAINRETNAVVSRLKPLYIQCIPNVDVNLHTLCLRETLSSQHLPSRLSLSAQYFLASI